MNSSRRTGGFDPNNIEFGVPIEVAPGILLLRLPLSIRLNHVNVYLFEDGEGWTVFDTGMAESGCYRGWEKTFASTLSGKRITRMICSHFHVDHVGLAGWLHERFAPSLHMSQTEYLLTRVFEMESPDNAIKRQIKFLCANGLAIEIAKKISEDRLRFGLRRTAVPDTFERLKRDQFIRIGGREWQVMTGGGHSVEQVMLYCAADRIFISADQVLAEISPNVSVGAMSASDDPLGEFLESLAAIKSNVAPDCLVLPAHRKPFQGLHNRIGELEAHHASRCEAILQTCREQERIPFELIPAVFGREFPDNILGLVLGEVLAHANCLWHRGLLEKRLNAAGQWAFRTAPSAERKEKTQQERPR